MGKDRGKRDADSFKKEGLYVLQCDTMDEAVEEKEEEYRICPVVEQSCLGETCMWFIDGKCIILRIGEKLKEWEDERDKR